MIKALVSNWVGAFGDGWRIARALPWLIVLMMGIEFSQHIVELHLGFFSADAAVRKAASMQPVRMAFGWPKMLILYAVGFFAMRHAVTGDVRATMRPSGTALRRYAGVVLFQLIPAVVTIYAEPIVAALGRPPADVMTVRGMMGIGQQLLEPLLFLWFVNAAAGSESYGPIVSARTTRWLYFWGLALMIVTRIPIGLLHQMLNRWPAGMAPAVQWILLAFDAAVVGVLALVLPAVQVRIARYIADRRGRALLDDGRVSGTAAH